MRRPGPAPTPGRRRSDIRRCKVQTDIHFYTDAMMLYNMMLYIYIYIYIFIDIDIDIDIDMFYA